MERDYRYNDNIDEGYTGKTVVVVAGSLESDLEHLDRLNGFKGKTNLSNVKGFPFKGMQPSHLRLSYGKADKTLFVSCKFVMDERVSDEDIEELKVFIEVFLKTSTDFSDVPYEEGNVKINLSPKNQLFIVNQSELEVPKGYMFIKDIMTTGDDFAGYQEFLNNKLMFDRLKYLCTKKDKVVPKEAFTGVMLPIHQKDPVSGSTCVMVEVEDIYAQYKLAQNYIRGFEVDSSENQMGILMMLSPEFAEYILMTAKRAVMGKKPNDTTYKEQIEKAVKYAEKHRKEYLTDKDVNDVIPDVTEL